MPDLTKVPWRVGMKVGRTIYAEVGDGDCLKDVLLGVMDTPELAAHAVVAHNVGVGWEPEPQPSE